MINTFVEKFILKYMLLYTENIKTHSTNIVFEVFPVFAKYIKMVCSTEVNDCVVNCILITNSVNSPCFLGM